MPQQKWTIDTVHSTVGFTVRHLLVSKVHGLFTKWQGTLEWDDQNPAGASAEATIDVSSVDTREPQRDEHLRSPDFFDAAKFPQITFKSTKIEPAGEGEFKVTGDLTMHGVTKPVVLAVEYAGSANHPRFGQRLGFSAKTTINRKDFGIMFNMVLDNGGLALSEKVEINIDVQAGKAA